MRPLRPVTSRRIWRSLTVRLPQHVRPQYATGNRPSFDDLQDPRAMGLMIRALLLQLRRLRRQPGALRDLWFRWAHTEAVTAQRRLQGDREPRVHPQHLAR